MDKSLFLDIWKANFFIDVISLIMQFRPKIALAVIAIAVLVGSGFYLWEKQVNPPARTTETRQPTPPVATTPEANIPTNWKSIDTGSFSISIPSSWVFNKRQGIDSMVGEFTGDGANLIFDYGLYSNSLVKDNDPNHIITHETIGDDKAKIVVPKVTGKGITGVYFADLATNKRFVLHGNNLTSSQQETVLKIFRTIKFNFKTL